MNRPMEQWHLVYVHDIDLGLLTSLETAEAVSLLHEALHAEPGHVDG